MSWQQSVFISKHSFHTLEKPAQDVRLAKRAEVFDKIKHMKENITSRLLDPNDNADVTINMIKDYSKAMAEIHNHPDEIVWDMLNAQASGSLTCNTIFLV